MTTSTRPLREDERRSIAGLESWSLIPELLFPALFVFLITFFVGVGIERALDVYCELGSTWPTIIGAVAALGLALYIYRISEPWQSKEREVHARDLAAGVAVCSTFDVVDALRVEEFEDEGSGYYLKLADGRVLFLQGQYLYEYENGEDEEGAPVHARFPADRFTVERTSASGIVLGVTDFGRLIPVSGVLRSFTPEEHEGHTVPQDGEILAVDFETLRHR